MSFLHKAVSPFHVVEEIAGRLFDENFEELSDANPWRISPLGRYFVTKNNTTIMAFAVGGKYKPGNGFAIIGSHTDSLAPRVKPTSRLHSGMYNQLAVLRYGGGDEMFKWFDRDFSVAGQVIVKTGQTMSRRLVRIEHPILYIPSIHEGSVYPKDSSDVKSERQYDPIFESRAMEERSSRRFMKGAPNEFGSRILGQPRRFIELIADAANTTPENIVDMDLFLYDTNQARIGGVHNEFITGGGTDNKVGTYLCMKALLDSLENEDELKNDENVRVLVCCDSEEIGNVSEMGAASSFIKHVLKRLTVGGPQNAYELAISRSMLITVDQTHAVHPNFPDKHEVNHHVKINGGPVSSIGVGFGTTATSIAILKKLAAEAKVPLQILIPRNNLGVGGTMSAAMAHGLGILTVDASGCSELAMHSARSLTYSYGVIMGVRLFSDSLTHEKELETAFPVLRRTSCTEDTEESVNATIFWQTALVVTDGDYELSLLRA